MDIALLTTTFVRKGRKKNREATEITVKALAKNFSEKGHKVAIINRGNGNIPKHERLGKINIHHPFKSELLTGLLGLFYVQSLRGRKFDVVHNFSAAPILSFKTLIAKTFLRCKTINTLKSYSRKDFYRFKFLKVLSHADKITVPTEIFKKRLIARGVPNKKIVVVRSNIDCSKFKSSNKTTLKKKFGFTNKKVILYFGALWEEKGLQYLVKAIPTLTEKHPNIQFIIAPRHKVREIDAPVIKAALRNKNVKLVLEVKDIVEYINVADAVVLPYKNLIATEGNPSCLLESMACKTPVVTSKLPEITEIVKDGEDVLMSKPGDVNGLVTQIDRILSDTKLRNKLIKSAHKKSKLFDEKKIAKKYLEIYNSA